MKKVVLYLCIILAGFWGQIGFATEDSSAPETFYLPTHPDAPKIEIQKENVRLEENYLARYAIKYRIINNDTSDLEFDIKIDGYVISPEDTIKSYKEERLEHRVPFVYKNLPYTLLGIPAAILCPIALIFDEDAYSLSFEPYIKTVTAPYDFVKDRIEDKTVKNIAKKHNSLPEKQFTVSSGEIFEFGAFTHYEDYVISFFVRRKGSEDYFLFSK